MLVIRWRRMSSVKSKTWTDRLPVPGSYANRFLKGSTRRRQRTVVSQSITTLFNGDWWQLICVFLFCFLVVSSIDRNTVRSFMCPCQKIDQIAWSHGFRWGRPAAATLGLSRPSSNTLSHAGNIIQTSFYSFFSLSRIHESLLGTLYLFIQLPPIHFSFTSIFIFFPLPFILSPGASFHDFFFVSLSLSLPSGLCPLSLSSLPTAKNGAVFYTPTGTHPLITLKAISLYFCTAPVIIFKTLR